MTTGTVFQGAFWLLAFTVAFYAFLAREKRIPSVANTTYRTIFLCFIATVLAIASSAISYTSASWAEGLLWTAHIFLVIAVLFAGSQVWRVRHRHINFRHDQLYRHMAPISWFSWLWKRLSRRKATPYKHNPIGIPQKLLDAVAALPAIDATRLHAAAQRHSGKELSLSIVIDGNSYFEADPVLLQLARLFLENDCPVQYTACARHPFEFILQLRHSWQSETKAWKEVTNKLVAVDAYSPHFGFTDSIHSAFSEHADLKDVALISSPPTYAGVHSAAMKAFKTIKKSVDTAVRPATLIIYEGTHALVDLESAEQYRIFVRHVLPSERIWGGMLTLVVEAGASPQDMATLRSYADLYIELDEDSGANTASTSASDGRSPQGSGTRPLEETPAAEASHPQETGAT